MVATFKVHDLEPLCIYFHSWDSKNGQCEEVLCVDAAALSAWTTEYRTTEGLHSDKSQVSAHH